MKRKYDLEERLIDFAVMVLQVTDKLYGSFPSKHLGEQLCRSATSPALNYGEAQGAESTKDFIHKMRICLKELRETQICLKIIERKSMMEDQLLQDSSVEVSELVAIFTKSIQTAKTRIDQGTKRR